MGLKESLVRLTAFVDSAGAEEIGVGDVCIVKTYALRRLDDAEQEQATRDIARADRKQVIDLAQRVADGIEAILRTFAVSVAIANELRSCLNCLELITGVRTSGSKCAGPTVYKLQIPPPVPPTQDDSAKLKALLIQADVFVLLAMDGDLSKDQTTEALNLRDEISIAVQRKPRSQADIDESDRKELAKTQSRYPLAPSWCEYCHGKFPNIPCPKCLNKFRARQKEAQKDSLK